MVRGVLVVLLVPVVLSARLPEADADLARSLRDVLVRANRLHAEGQYVYCAGLCEGALRMVRPLAKQPRLARKVLLGLEIADLETSAERKATRLKDLLAEVGKSLGVEVPAEKKPAAGGELTAEEKQLLELVNAERKKEGVPALRVSKTLFALARAHSENMAKQDRLGHELDGKGAADRLRDAGYTFRAMGENVAAGQRTPAEAMDSWMKSEGHRRNLLNAELQEVGLGVAVSKEGTRYWTQVFATPLR